MIYGTYAAPLPMYNDRLKDENDFMKVKKCGNSNVKGQQRSDITIVYQSGEQLLGLETGMCYFLQ